MVAFFRCGSRKERGAGGCTRDATRTHPSLSLKQRAAPIFSGLETLSWVCFVWDSTFIIDAPPSLSPSPLPPPTPSPSPFPSSSAAATARRSARRSYRTAAVRGDQRLATEPLRASTASVRRNQHHTPPLPPAPPDSTAPSSSVTWRHKTAALPSSRNLTDPKR